MPGYIVFAGSTAILMWGKTTVRQAPIAQAKRVGRYWTLDSYLEKVNGHAMDPSDLTPLHTSAVKTFNDYQKCLVN